jgi:hypothetical protein
VTPASVTPASERTRPSWLFLLRPKWLCWHAFAVLATLGMLWLGRWQLHRAESGNELSWAYTVEWPLFAIFGLLFWARSLREEVRGRIQQPAAGPDAAGRTDSSQSDADAAYLDRLRAEVQGHGRWHGWR